MVCLDPDMEKAPEGTWSCPHCVRTIISNFFPDYTFLRTIEVRLVNCQLCHATQMNHFITHKKKKLRYNLSHHVCFETKHTLYQTAVPQKYIISFMDFYSWTARLLHIFCEKQACQLVCSMLDKVVFVDLYILILCQLVDMNNPLLVNGVDKDMPSIKTQFFFRVLKFVSWRNVQQCFHFGETF